MASFFNSSLIPSPVDLLWAVPRLAHRASVFAFADIPEHLDLFLSRAKLPGSSIADATSSQAYKSNVSLLPSGTFTTKNTAVAASAVASAAATTTGDSSFLGMIQDWGLYRLSNVDGIFSYLASRWAISTFIIAIILNRAHVYASSRRHLRLNWRARLVLRIVPIGLFLHQVLRLLQTMHCQTGPLEVPESASLPWSFINEQGPLYRLSSTLLFWQDHTASCINSGMISTTDDPTDYIGSSAILWPLFLDFCISHVVETISSALQGRQPMAETGMTIFEHSLAFAEAEAVVRGSVGLGFFGLPRFSSAQSAASKSATSGPRMSHQAVLRRLNVPPEVLLIGLISCGSHLSSQGLGIAGLQSRFRLVNTAIWGICFMAAFLWSFWKFAEAPIDDDVRVLRYPTVCIIGFIPHMLILFGILVCALIYAIALAITMISPPTPEFRQGSFSDRLRMAHGNLQANVSLARINFSWREEFYTTLLKIGFYVMNAASEAVYFNETVSVLSGTSTWLEDRRAAELAHMAKRMQDSLPHEIQGDVVQDGTVSDALGMIDEHLIQHKDGRLLHTGYARERKVTKTSAKVTTASMREEGVGGNQRTSRWLMAVKLSKQIWVLMVRVWARAFTSLLSKSGLGRFKRLDKLAGLDRETLYERPKPRQFWSKTADGRTTISDKAVVDVEAEIRERLVEESDDTAVDEASISSYLYRWWRLGGEWGELDGSGDYAPSTVDEDDLTSMISEAPEMSDTESEAGWEIRGLQSEGDEGSGRRTPTQRDYSDQANCTSRESTPGVEGHSLADLARLLDPKTPEDRESAALLSRRLTSSGPMTRSRYRRTVAADQARVFGSTTYALLAQTHLSPEDEENILEQILLSRRPKQDATEPASGKSTGWAEGAEGLGADGPQCVVCHSAPRSIIVWPCRCLSLCEECRVSLAVNNFGSCVCCRRDVVAFSRLYVP